MGKMAQNGTIVTIFAPIHGMVLENSTGWMCNVLEWVDWGVDPEVVVEDIGNVNGPGAVIAQQDIANITSKGSVWVWVIRSILPKVGLIWLGIGFGD